MMTKKDFELFAELLSGYKFNLMTADVYQYPEYSTPEELWATIVRDTADKFAAENPRFNRDRYYSACGYMEEEDVINT